jgi:hypothetical protein
MARKLGAFAAAAALSLVVVACMSGTQAEQRATTTTREPPAASPPDDAAAEMVALGFLEAFGAFDVEKARSYLAADATIASIGERDDLRLLVSWLEVTGYEQNLHSCRERGGSALGTTVRCTFDFHALRSGEIGRGPFRGSSFDLVVRDGKIVRASQNWNIGKFSPQVWEPFARWVAKAYPEHVAVMYRDAGQSNVTLSPDSIARWRTDTWEYAEANAPKPVRIAETFMRARNTHDAEKAISLLADDGVRAILWNTVSGVGSVPLSRRQLALAFEAERLLELRFTSIDCRRESVPTNLERRRPNVVCDCLIDSKLRRLAGLGPKDWHSGLRIRDGRVDLLSFHWMNISWDPSGYEPAEAERFVRWLGAAHPEAIDVENPYGGGGWLFRSAGQEWILRLNRRTLELFAGYLGEYERSVNG